MVIFQAHFILCLSKPMLTVYCIQSFSGCAKSAVTASVALLWDPPDSRFIAMTATERCLPSLQPLLLRHVYSCPKRLLSKRVSETGRGSRQKLTKRENGCRETRGGSTETWRGNLRLVVRWGTGSGRWIVASEGAVGRDWVEGGETELHENELLEGELEGDPSRSSSSGRTFPHVEQALPALPPGPQSQEDLGVCSHWEDQGNHPQSHCPREAGCPSALPLPHYRRLVRLSKVLLSSSRISWSLSSFLPAELPSNDVLEPKVESRVLVREHPCPDKPPELWRKGPEAAWPGRKTKGRRKTMMM